MPPETSPESAAGRFGALGEAELQTLDRLLESAEHTRWQGFYADRQRACPFFVDAPDENLVEWLDRGLIAAGAALDLGCGNGRNAVHLAQRGFAVQGVDLSAQALQWAGERAQRQGVVLDLLQASVFDRPPAVASLDLVYDSGCFHHIAPHRRQGYIRLLARALRAGGLLGLVCFRPEGGSGWTDDEVYRRGSLGGGLGYTEADLRALWGGCFEIVELRRMHAQPAGSARFGLPGLWVMLARLR
ncbi:SAM-dependent methyltransferase [Rubrivivax gelatinosus]|nr:SAM-dependent methyltransferase [Rubrivivax gelatinosus]